MNLTSFAKAQAKALGADLVAVAPALLPDAPGGPEAYQRWVAEGRHATMHYMARDPAVRGSITRWFPGAKSVLILGFSYAGPPEDAPLPEGHGRFARYALAPDYHDVLRGKLDALLARLQTFEPGIQGKSFVDSSPVLERLYARWAGLGWVGKNTMLIHPKLGSLFFLTGLAVDRELEADEPRPDHCGSCTRCLEACPTDAFPAPRVLDASKCIAYFTIEHRGSLPEEYRSRLDGWAFGCDVCQDVCPWNRFARENSLFKRVLRSSEPLEDLASLSPAEFESRFGRTPVERARRRGLVRNALALMGTSRDPRYRETLERFAADADPVLSEQARWSLARLPPSTQD